MSIDRLREIISEIGSCAVAYSGGADSAFLADVAHEIHGADRCVAVTAVSESLASSEREAAAALARQRGWRHIEIETREIERAEYRANEPDRCYHCKTELFERLDELGPSLGVEAVLVGTNLDDTGDFRPGQRAARERGVRAPLLEAGLGKDEIRALSRERGLPTWDKPASACLASRIAYGVEVTAERLDRVGRAEALLRSMGVRELRVRDHGELARIEVPVDEIPRLASSPARETLAEGLAELGFAYVTLDLQGFSSGSMNRTLLRIQPARG
ncbi:MAG TPA: ATP-dependent sacrificial sulfur transferase LarE [Actinomycetota bacterium]|nr:ATP-dependent sacrificial sulfur transferase LarE [Actinomycetota bacterium]